MTFEITAEEFQHLIGLITNINATTYSIYAFVGFIVGVALPICALVWILKKIFSPFLGRIL